MENNLARTENEETTFTHCQMLTGRKIVVNPGGHRKSQIQKCVLLKGLLYIQFSVLFFHVFLLTVCGAWGLWSDCWAWGEPAVCEAVIGEQTALLSETHAVGVIASWSPWSFSLLVSWDSYSQEEKVCLAACGKQIKQSLLWGTGRWPLS